MAFEKYYIVANTREQFENESKQSNRPYNDHPSLESVNYVVQELRKCGFDAEFFGGVERLIEAYSKKHPFPNTLFLNLSDGLTQVSRKAQSAILLELLGCPYAGSDPLASLMAGNKAYSKRIVSEKLKVPEGRIVFNDTEIPQNIKFPVIIKPNREGSSIGITQESICTNIIELEQRTKKLLSAYGEVLVEEYIPGYEITCFIVGNKGNYYLVEPLLIEYDGIFYYEDFVFGLEEKANRKRKEYLAKTILPVQQIDQICSAAKTAFELLNMRDFARVDFRLRKDGQLYFIEINGNAVISKTSEVGVIGHALNIPFGSIVGDIIRSATDRLNANHD